MTESKLNKSTAKAHALDEATQELIHSIRKNDNRLRTWILVSWTVLLLVGVFGIYKQNEIANANKAHIDCIVKLFTTPQPPGATSHRVIVNPDAACKIKVTN